MMKGLTKCMGSLCDDCADEALPSGTWKKLPCGVVNELAPTSCPNPYMDITCKSVEEAATGEASANEECFEVEEDRSALLRLACFRVPKGKWFVVIYAADVSERLVQQRDTSTARAPAPRENSGRVAAVH